MNEDLGGVAWERRETVGIATITRPSRRNALDASTCDRLGARLGIDEHVRAVIITGDGDVFSSGADLKADPDDAGRLGDAMVNLLDRVAACPVPVIAALNGPAIGLGALLALGCDLRVAAPAASFEVPAARIGRTLKTPLIERLVVAVGPNLAKRLLLANEVMTAEQAFALGLVSRVCDPALEGALELSRSVVSLSAGATADHKRIVNGLSGIEPR